MLGCAPMSRPIRVVVMGLGQIGCALARSVLGEPRLRFVAGVDAAAHLAGRPLREVVGDARLGRGRVLASLAEAPAADVVAMTTASRFAEIAPSLLAAAKRGLHVVSSCEELAHPRSFDAPLAV